MKEIVKMRFGSHLYGTSTPESDIDYKGIFMPSNREIFLNRIPKSIVDNTKKTSEEGVKNSAEDIDSEMYSLHYFIKLACEGQTIALDMLHAHDEVIETYTHLWWELVSWKRKFYTKSTKAFIGYARRQASKYGVKGSRLANAESVLKFLEIRHKTVRMTDLWDMLPEGEHIHKHENDLPIRIYEVCGRKIQETVTAEYALDIVSKFVSNYGQRAILAKENKGVDWKAVSHALRAAYQIREMFLDNTITFPRPEADFLLKVKKGELDFTAVSKILDDLIDEVEGLSVESHLPEKVNMKWWDNWLKDAVENEVKKGI